MVIASIKEVSAGCIKITTSTGPSFFIRDYYLTLVNFDSLVPFAEFIAEEEDDILNAGLAFAAEKKAIDYLARAEQSRQGLQRKLSAKEFDGDSINKALDYLEKVSYLCDQRFARAWLNNRKISHSEGRTKLASELAFRGISRTDANAALDEFFEQNDEETLCRKALIKCRRIKKSDEKTQAYLLKAGFPYRMVQNIMSEESTDNLDFLKDLES